MKHVTYKTVLIKTAGDLRKAEQLQANGWQVGTVGLESIQFYKHLPHAIKGTTVTVKH